MKPVILVIFLLLPVVAAFSGGGSETDTFEDRFLSMSWDEIVTEARGSELYWYMRGGSESIASS